MSQRSSGGLSEDDTDEPDGIGARLDITACACSDSGKRVQVWRLWFLFFMHFKTALKKRRVASSRSYLAEDFPLEDVEGRVEECGADDGGDTLSASFEISTTACSASGRSFWSSQLRLRLRFIGRLAARRGKPHLVIHVGTDDEEGEVGYDEHLIRGIVKEKDLDLLRKFGGVERVSLLLDSRSKATANPDSTDCPIDLNSWRKDNIILRKGFGHFLFKSINSFTIIFLLMAAGLSFPIDMTEDGAKYGWRDGVAILVAVFVLVAFSSLTNFNQQIKMEKKLRKDENEMEVHVERGGKSATLSISDVVVGDRVKLREGDRVPADGLFLSGEDLAVDDVLNPEVNYEENPFLLAGSKVTKGHCCMIVIAVGVDTALGDRLSSVMIHPTEKSLLQSLLDKPYIFIDKIALLVSVLIALVVLVRLLFGKHGSHFDMPEIKGETKLSQMLSIFGKLLLKPQGRVSILIKALAAVGIGIQHGMLLVITISLSFWKEKFVSNHWNPQNLSACGTVGLISVICFDITGALFCNQIAVEKFWIGEKDVKVDTEERIDQDLLEILAQAMSVSGPEPKTYQADDAVISFAKSQWDMSVELLDRNLSSTNNGVRETEDGEQKYCKGAASTILKKCSHYYDTRGEVQAMEHQKSTFELEIREMEINGLRPIAFSCKQANVQELKEDNMHLLALVGLKYLCQEETKKTLENLRDAGLRVILVSEDELVLAKVIASELGIFQCTSDNVAIEGAEIETLANGAMAKKLTLVGNSLPKHKLLLVEKLQEEGEVVAFFGGMSASDVPALKIADVGIVEDNKSMEIAKLVSDIIVEGVESLTRVHFFGQNVYSNIQTFYQLQLTGSLSGLLIALFSTISSGGSPITAIHIIWVNLIGSLLGCLMMTMDLKGKETQVSQEGKRNQQLITKVIWTKIAFQVLYQACVVLMIEYLGKHLSGMNEEVQQPVVLNTFTLCQIFNLLNAMEITKREVFMVVLSNYSFLLALGAVPVIQAMLLPYTERFTGCARLSAEKWAFCIVVAALPWMFKWLVYIFSFIPSIHFPLILGR